MPSEPVLSVLILWHQHQPFYKDLLSNRYELPWVRLHATKDYYDMAALLDEFPKIRLNFNLVPSLLAQLDDYGQGKAEEKSLALARKAAQELSFEDRTYLLSNFFMAHWGTMIDPYPRYRELLDKRGRSAHEEDLPRVQNYFKEQDWRDLQVWFNLSWFDPLWRERDPQIRQLHEKGRNFTESDKGMLLDKQQKICAEVAGKHKELADRGQIEISASPYYHPILPLLCDTESARSALPHAALPLERFSHPEDARSQVQRSLGDHERRFGRRPAGMWPSEGSVSEAACQILAECGVRWAATDEAILAYSLPPGSFHAEDLFEPYRYQAGGKTLDLFFRDHELSDAIGFTYATWNPSDAVQDLIRRLHEIHQRLIRRDGGQPRPHVVPIILDGENCWEYYREDGLPFLRQLYRSLSEDSLLETVLASDYLNRHPPARTLEHLWAGSWINANFAIWIGHDEDNKAWDLLSRTRQFLADYLRDHPQRDDSPEAKLAWEEIYIAEGSDWCWWYGEDHSSANDAKFDYLFRKHLMNVYTLLGVKVPEVLHVAIKQKRARTAVKPPVDFITPQVDGRVTSYFEWQAAGMYQTEAGGTGTMHRAQNIIKTVYFGFDLQNLYFRFDLNRALNDPILESLIFKVIFINPECYEIDVQLTKDARGILMSLNRKSENGGSDRVTLSSAAAQKVIELSIPLSSISVKSTIIDFVISVQKNNLEQERWPIDSTISFPYPSESSFSSFWQI